MVEQVEASTDAHDRRTLADVALLTDLAPDERVALEKRCRWRRYRLGERVFERGTVGKEVFFVIEGAVNIVSFSTMGREITFATAQAGEAFGELAAIDGQARSASVVAAEDSMLAVLPADAFLALIRQHGEIAIQVLRKLSSIVRAGDERVVQVSSQKATNRVYSELLRLAEPDTNVPDLWVVSSLPPLREIAGQASTTRELVSNALNQLYPSGIIRRKGNKLYILDRLAMEEIIKKGRKAAGSR